MSARKRKGPGGARVGAGRPPLGPDARSVSRTIKLTPLELAAQEAAAAREGLTWSEWVRAAIARGSTP